MDVRGKLVELLYEADRNCNNKQCETCKHQSKKFFCKIHFYIDHLITHGVTVSEGALPVADAATERSAAVDKIEDQRKPEDFIGNRKPVQEWISVKDRLPELIPCSIGTAYSEAVNVLTSGRKVLTAIWDGTDFIADADFWDAEGEEITHWTPVLLPLPDPTEEER